MRLLSTSDTPLPIYPTQLHSILSGSSKLSRPHLLQFSDQACQNTPFSFQASHSFNAPLLSHLTNMQSTTSIRRTLQSPHSLPIQFHKFFFSPTKQTCKVLLPFVAHFILNIQYFYIFINSSSLILFTSF